MRIPLSSAALGAAAVALMSFFSRLPPNGDFLLPRRGGYWVYRAAWALSADTAGRVAVQGGAILLLLLSAASLFLAWRRAAPRRRPRSWSGYAGLAAGPLFAAVLAFRLAPRVLDIVALVWFPYGAMDAREPLAVFILFFLILSAAVLAGEAWLSGRRRRGSAFLGALIAFDILSALIAARAGIGEALPAHGGEGRTLYVVMTQTASGPGRDVYALRPNIFSDTDPRPDLERRASAGFDARTLPALRALYQEQTKRWDLPGLRSALLLGCSRGDALARALLLAHLTAVLPSAEALSALGALADEDVYRVGPMGAAALARAYAHLGAPVQAEHWTEKAAIPAELLALETVGALKPGRVSGVVKAPARARVALYLKKDAAAPYLLDASSLVAATEPNARGRFSFSGLPAGRYYLAFALADTGADVSVSGSRGDIVLDTRRRSIELPTISLRWRDR